VEGSPDPLDLLPAKKSAKFKIRVLCEPEFSDPDDQDEADAIQWAITASTADYQQHILTDLKLVKQTFFNAKSNLGSAGGAPLDDDDDSWHACRGSSEL